MRRVAILLLVSAVTACGGAGTFLAEMGVGAGLGCGAFLGASVFTMTLDGGWEFAVPVFAFMGGAGYGVYIAGELLDGPSRNPGASFVAAVGGSALGTTVGVAPGILVAVASEGDTGAVPGIFFAVVGGVSLGAAASAWLYNAAKKAAAPGAGGPTVAPTIAALPPRAPGEAPTLTFGLAASF
jgi:hypothetical protein